MLFLTYTIFVGAFFLMMVLQQLDGVGAAAVAWHNQRPLSITTPLGVPVGAAGAASHDGVLSPRRTAQDCEEKFFVQTVRWNERPAGYTLFRVCSIRHSPCLPPLSGFMFS